MKRSYMARINGHDVQTDGTLTLSGGNIIGDTRTIDGADPQTGIALTDIFASVTNNPDTGVLSGTLASNGGPVQTIALNEAASNPALDAGSDRLAPATDARGFSRDDVAGAANNGANVSDLGAFEASHSLVVTTSPIRSTRRTACCRCARRLRSRTVTPTPTPSPSIPR